MNTFSQRLAYAMECMQMRPSEHQTHLAKLVGHGCKPQNIQHLLDQSKNARSSKYTPMIASVLQCDTLWLATGNGIKPEPKHNQTPREEAVYLVAKESHAEGQYWPWSVSAARIANLPPDFFGRLDGYIEGRVEEFERAKKSHQGSQLGERAA